MPAYSRQQRLISALAFFIIGHAFGYAIPVNAEGITPSSSATIAPKGFITTGPATIGMVFRKGDLPKGAHVLEGKQLAKAQLDPLVYWPDGSLKFARITVTRAGQYRVVSGPLSMQTLKPTSFRASMAIPDFKVEVKTAHRTLALTLYQMKFHRHSCGPLLCILSFPATPLVNSRTGTKAPNLALRAWVWEYPTLGTSLVVATLENTWAQTAASNVATRDIRFLLNGQTVFQQANVTIWRWSRTRPVRKWTGTKVGDHATRNLEYMRRTHLIPNYNPRLLISENVLKKFFQHFKESKHGLMGHSIITPYMPQTGGRGDIGPLPTWDTFALLTNNPMALQLSRNVDDSSAVWPIHLRSRQTGAPLSIARYPQASTLAVALGNNVEGNPIPCWKHNCRDTYPNTETPLKPDVAHEPALNYVPYLLTADPFFLEELRFWNNWNALSLNPGYRSGSKVIFLSGYQQVRAMAWQLRTLGYLAAILPEQSTEKRFWDHVIQTNLNVVKSKWISSNHWPEPVITGAYGANRNGIRAVAPWQEDFLTWALSNMSSLGFNGWKEAARWNAYFVVNRITSPGICPTFATIYGVRLSQNGKPIGRWKAMVTATATGGKSRVKRYMLTLPCDSIELKKALHLPRRGDFMGYPQSPQGFVANMQPALAAAVDLGVPGASQAWTIYQRRPTKQNYREYPNWDIIPRHQDITSKSAR